jgi:hypothetical protein
MQNYFNYLTILLGGYMFRQYPEYYYGNLVAGTTAGQTSPGAMGYSAGFPAPISFGASVPPLIAAQTQPQSTQQGTQTLDKVLQDLQLEAGAIALGNRGYTQGYLKTLIGKLLRVEFLLGESNFQDRIGVLLEVGTDYIILREIETDDDLLCDAFTIKYVMEYK